MASKYNRDDYNLTVYEVRDSGEIRVRQVQKRNTSYFYIREKSGRNYEKMLHQFAGWPESRRVVFEDYDEAVAELRYLQNKEIVSLTGKLEKAKLAFFSDPVVKIWNY